MTDKPKPGKGALVRFTGLDLTTPAQQAFARGDRRGLLLHLAHDLGLGTAGLDDLEPRALVLAERVAELAIEVRRESVAVIGQHDAFVRKTKDGSLAQVVRPVHLSLENKTLWQIVKRRPVDVETGKIVANIKNHRGRYEWQEAPIDPGRASVTYTGFLALNAVASCAVGQPPHVYVDGEKRTNPYVDRVQRKDGRLGDIVRIVISVCVVGPAPATGNPVVVNYTLDYDPGKDFANMLSFLAEGEGSDDCYLAPEPEELEKGWAWHPLYGGIGYLFNLRNQKVIGVYGKFIEIQGNALKKAQTVARRNAMKSHPALAIHDCVINGQGKAVVPMIGWAGDQGTMDRWTKLQDRLARGIPLDDQVDVNIIDLDPESYEVEQEQGLGSAEDSSTMTTTTEEVQPDPSEQAADRERNELIAYIDQGIGILSPKNVRNLKYDPANNTLEELRSIRDNLDAIAGGAR